MFVARQKELYDFNEAYNSNVFQAVILYGRRRVGKTYLINHFAKDKPVIIFTAQEAKDKINLLLFTKKFSIFLPFGQRDNL